MSNKLKVLGLAVLAALAVSSVVSGSVSATGSGHFTYEAAPAEIHGTQEGTFVNESEALPSISCPTATLTGSADQPTKTELDVSPPFEGCATSLGSAHVNLNGCFFRMTIETHAETTDNAVHIVCPGPVKYISLAVTSFVGTCHIKIPEQTPSGGVRYTTAGLPPFSVHHVKADLKLTGVTETKHPTGVFACAGVATHNALGEYIGTATLKASRLGGTVGVTATGSTGT